jgi:hypothetical protein
VSSIRATVSHLSEGDYTADSFRFTPALMVPGRAGIEAQRRPGPHGNYYGMEAKFARMKQGVPNPFVDPDGYKSCVAEREQAFRTELERQKAAER